MSTQQLLHITALSLSKSHTIHIKVESFIEQSKKKGKAVPLHVMEALGGRGDIAPTHS
jgi:hypothetical protein